MSAVVVLVVIIAVVVVIAAVATISRQQRTQRLRERFGPEYSRAVEEYGNTRKAEPALIAREKRVGDLHIRTLSPAERDRFADAWRSVQARFVDDPAGATNRADQLVADLMATRGYPVGDFEQRAADISVDHPTVVEHYRTAHEIALQQEQGQASTEDLRTALVHYRALFEDLLETSKEPVGRAMEAVG
jgi:hypothetical protein